LLVGLTVGEHAAAFLFHPFGHEILFFAYDG